MALTVFLVQSVGGSHCCLVAPLVADMETPNVPCLEHCLGLQPPGYNEAHLYIDWRLLKKNRLYAKYVEYGT